jgi:hypothetical protein
MVVKELTATDITKTTKRKTIKINKITFMLKKGKIKKLK